MTGTSLHRRAKRVHQGGGLEEGAEPFPPATYSNIPLPPTGLKEPYPCYVLFKAHLGLKSRIECFAGTKFSFRPI